MKKKAFFLVSIKRGSKEEKLNFYLAKLTDWNTHHQHSRHRHLHTQSKLHRLLYILSKICPKL